jgi:hypothetical protein
VLSRSGGCAGGNVRGFRRCENSVPTGRRIDYFSNINARRIIIALLDCVLTRLSNLFGLYIIACGVIYVGLEHRLLSLIALQRQMTERIALTCNQSDKHSSVMTMAKGS